MPMVQDGVELRVEGFSEFASQLTQAGEILARVGQGIEALSKTSGGGLSGAVDALSKIIAVSGNLMHLSAGSTTKEFAAAIDNVRILAAAQDALSKSTQAAFDNLKQLAVQQATAVAELLKMITVSGNWVHVTAGTSTKDFVAAAENVRQLAIQQLQLVQSTQGVTSATQAGTVATTASTAANQAATVATAALGQSTTQTATASSQFVGALTKMGGPFGNIVRQLQQGATAGAIFGGIIGSVVGAALVAGANAVKDFTAALVDLVGSGINAVIDGMKELASATADYLAEGTKMAGQWRELEFGAQAVGLEMGYTTQQIKDSIQAVADVNIRYDEAARSILLMAQNEIELSKATELATIAQGVGVTRAMDSSEAFRMMTLAIASGNTHRLRTLGIMVQMTKAETEYAAVLGKSREAMSSAERVQARLNAVLEWGANLGAVYAAAMASPTKVLRSITERLLPTIQAALGEPFLNGLGYVVSAFYDLATAMVAAMREGTPLYYLLVDIGAAFAMMAEPVADVINWITKWFTGLDTSITTTLEGTVSNALSWGFNISAALAEGLIAGASYIVDAITAIANLIASWLAPGSPPRALPELTWWGTQAMVEYLHGFELADFSVIENIQGIIERLLTPEAFRDLSAEMIEAMATGQVDDSMFDRIAAATGRFGEEVAELARKEFALADAIKQVEEAQLAFDAAVLAVEDAQNAVKGLTDEYNMLLKTGADPALLEAKLAEVNAAEDGLAQRQQESIVADQNLDAANERKDAIEDERDLQRALVQQLLALAESTNTAAESMRKALKKAAGGAGELGAELEAGIAPVMGRIFDKMQEDIEKRKEELKKRLGEMFDTAFGPLEGKARELATKIDNILMGMFGVKLFEGLDDPQEKFETIFNELGQPVGFREVPFIERMLDRIVEVAGAAFTTIKNAINNDVIPALQALGVAAGIAWDAIEAGEKAQSFIESITKISGALAGLSPSINILTLLASAIASVGVAAGIILGAIARAFEGFADLVVLAVDITNWLVELEIKLERWLYGDTLQNLARQWGGDVSGAAIDGLVGGVEDTEGGFTGKLLGIVSSAIDAVKSLLGISSPSSVFMEIGGNIIEGLIQGALNILGGIGTKIAEGIAALFGEESVLKLVETAFADLRAPIEEFATWFGETSVELQGDVTDLADSVTLKLLAASIKFVNYVRSTFNPTLDTLSTKLKTAKTNTDNLGTAISALKDKATAAYGPVRSLKDIVNDLGDELYGTASDAWSLHGALSEIADSDGVLVRLGRRMDDFRNGPLREVRNSFGSLLSTLLAIIAALRLMGNTLGGGGGGSSMVAESPNTITDVPMQRRIFMPQSIQPQMIFDQAALAQAQPAQVSIGPNYFTSTVNAERVVQTWKRQMARELAIS